MRSKKNESIRKRKYGKKKSYKSKKCGCGMKIPFLKWGGDSPNGQVPTKTSDLSSRISGLFTNLKNATDATTSKLTGDFNEVTRYFIDGGYIYIFYKACNGDRCFYQWEGDYKIIN